jgi:Ca2+-binding EF-hand superfamily protein
VVAVILDSFTWLYSLENSRGKNAATVDDLNGFKNVWQKYDTYGTGSIAHKHLKALLQEVGEPIGREKVTFLWFKALQAEIAAIPGASQGEISFRNLFLILTTRMAGAGANWHACLRV